MIIPSDPEKTKYQKRGHKYDYKPIKIKFWLRNKESIIPINFNFLKRSLDL